MNPSFVDGYLQRAWDSVSLSALKKCPRYYQLSLIEEWRKKAEAIPLVFGIAYHKALEIYDNARAQGADFVEAQRTAIRFCFQQSFTSDDNRRTRATLIRAVCWYLEQFKHDPCETVLLKNGRPAVELSFRIELPVTSPSGEPYLLCGHLDKLVMFNDKLWVLDRKTTGMTLSQNYFATYSPNTQMSQYTFAGKIITSEPVAGVIIDAVQLAVGFNNYQRAFTTRTQPQLDEWLGDVLRYVAMAERFAAERYWPMNDTACSMYGGCPFRDVCSKDPAVREAYLKGDFEKVQWNPLQVREAP